MTENGPYTALGPLYESDDPIPMGLTWYERAAMAAGLHALHQGLWDIGIGWRGGRW